MTLATATAWAESEVKRGYLLGYYVSTDGAVVGETTQGFVTLWEPASWDTGWDYENPGGKNA